MRTEEELSGVVLEDAVSYVEAAAEGGVESILLQELTERSTLRRALTAQGVMTQPHCAGESGVMPSELLATGLLEGVNLSPADASRLVLELLEYAGGGYEGMEKQELVSHCRQVIQLGAEAFCKVGQSRPFSQVVSEMLLHKVHRRRRTIGEIKQYCERLMRSYPEWRDRSMRDFNEEMCKEAVSAVFSSPVMQRKAYVILHGVFNFGMRRAWCSSNPIALIDIPRPQERRIRSLTMRELTRLIKTALMPEHLPCAPALGLMLWAGVRPNEIERLTWGNVFPKENCIEIQPQHSKTGGHRHVTMQPALKVWLRRVSTYTFPDAPIAPRAWDRRWRALRRSAGFAEWQADILRHTFASYHLKHFRDLSSLQLEMGHATSELLRTRYLALNGITVKAAQDFWTCLPRLEKGE